MSKKAEVLGFGFIPEQNEHHFLVTLPHSLAKEAVITISEHFEWSGNLDKESEYHDGIHSQIKVNLKRYQWESIADEVRAEFNRRLRTLGIKSGKWKKRGTIAIDRSLGKELVLLGWAIEDAEQTLTYNAIRNWLGLAPEERWWLYIMTNAATGHATKGKGVGWRKAVRFALTENPVSGTYIPKVSNELKLKSELTSKSVEKKEQSLFEE